MRSSIKRSVTGLLVVGVVAFSAVGAYAIGPNNGPDAFIGIIGGNPGYYPGGSYTHGPFNPGRETGDAYRSGHGGNGGNSDGGYYRGY